MGEKYLLSTQGVMPMGFRIANLHFYGTADGIIVDPTLVGEVHFARTIVDNLNELTNLRARIVELEARLDIGTGNMYDVVVAENEKLRARIAVAVTRLHNLENMRDGTVDWPAGEDETDDQIRKAIADLEGKPYDNSDDSTAEPDA